MNKKTLSNKLHSAERGQAILLIALAMVGLVAFVGLMVDMGILFIEQGKIKRGIDSGAIAAAQQFRKGFLASDLVAAANNFLLLNDTAADNIIIYRCKDNDPEDGIEDTATVGDGTVQDATLCTDPRRKLIRVEAQRWVPFSFLRVVGLQGRMISASSVSEAASIDIVLVIDTSTSMSYDTYTGPCATGGLETHCAIDGTLVDEENPAVCNVSVSKPCEPLHSVKNVALDFVDTMFLPYDRVAIVSMTSQVADGLRPPETVLELSGSLSAVQAAINGLRVFQPPVCDTVSGPCIKFGDVDHDDNPDTDGIYGFAGLDCPVARSDPWDPSSCNSSNIGGALYLAGNRFVEPGYRRDESLWIIILLAGGPANATDSVTGKPDGFCPDYTWINQTVNPLCRGADVSESTRHYNPITEAADFDADDYARLAADYQADPDDGNGITIFTIGLGELVIHATRGDADAGEQLLTYIATEAGDDPNPVEPQANHGTYSFAPDASALDGIFAEIAANIFTRITR